MSAAAVLVAARDALTPETWGQLGAGGGPLRNYAHGVCLGMAIHRAEADVKDLHTATVAVERVIREQFPDRVCDFDLDGLYLYPYFNDHRDTTLADVHLVFDKAIAEVDR